MSKKPIGHYQHRDKRANNPTQELGGFAADAETQPDTTSTGAMLRWIRS